MKISIFILSFFLLFAPVANAQDSTSSASTPDGSITKEQRKDAINKRQAAQAEFREKVKTQREEAKKRFAGENEKFSERLNNLNDEKKAAIIEKIGNRLTIMNTKYTDKLTNATARLEEILNKITEDTEAAKNEGKDTAETEAAIATATDSIETAKTAIVNQASKEYIPDISNTDNLGESVSETVQALKSDLKEVFGIVKDAKNKVKDAAQKLRDLIKE